MKQCPNCHRNYLNYAAPFCAEDGTRLIEVFNNASADAVPPTQYSIPQPSPVMPEYQFRVQNQANGNFDGNKQTGFTANILGALAILVSLGGLLFVVVATNYTRKLEGMVDFILFVSAAVGLTLAAMAFIFAGRAGKTRVVAVLGILASLIPLGSSIFNIGGYYADKAGLFDSFNSSRSDSTSTTTDDSDTASNTPRDVIAAFTGACMQRDVAAVKREMSREALSGLEKEADRRNMTLDALITQTMIDPIKADMDNGGKIQVRNEIISGNRATHENSSNGTKWGKSTYIIEDGRWKLTKN